MVARVLDIAIIGAGLAGLSTALFLREQHHTVTIYERNKGLSEVGAGIQIPPNASRLLARVGVLEKLESVATQPNIIQLRRYANGETLQKMHFASASEQTIRNPYMMIHRAEYQKVLYDAAVPAGVKILFDSDIVDIDEDSPALVLEGSRQIKCDLVIGADGVNSRTRQSILDASASCAIVNELRAYRATVTRDMMMHHTVGRSFIESSFQNIWIGPGRHVVGYPMGEHQAFNLVMIHPGRSDSSAQTWNEKGSTIEMKEAYKDFNADVRKLLDLVVDVRTWKLMEVPKLESWSSKNGRVVLIGDAAHAMLPFAAQGAAQAVEDGAVLAACLAHIANNVSIKECVDVYTRLRKLRAEKIASVARMNGDVWHMHDGPKQEARDRAWRDLQNVTQQSTVNTSTDRPPMAKLMQWMYELDVIEEANAAMIAVNSRTDATESRRNWSRLA